MDNKIFEYEFERLHKTIKKFRNLDFLRQQILSKNSEESPRTGNNFYQLSEDIRISRFSTSLSEALFFGGTNISSAKCYFFVPGYLTLIMPKRFRTCFLRPKLSKGYLPGTKGYVIYSPGTAPRDTYIKLFLFRCLIVM